MESIVSDTDSIFFFNSPYSILSWFTVLCISVTCRRASSRSIFPSSGTIFRLDVSNDWKWVWTDRQLDQDHVYTYFLDGVQEHKADGTVVENFDGFLSPQGGILTQGTDGKWTATISNVQKRPVGSLAISKAVTVNGEKPNGSQLADGTYTFEIWNADATSQITKDAGGADIGSLQIVVSGGTAAQDLTVDNLPAGTYVVKETGSTNHATVIDTTVDGYDSTLGGIVVTVTADDTADIQTAAFINNYETTEATVRKIWLDNNNSGNTRPSSLTATLYANGESTGQTVTLTPANWTTGVTISNLPKYENGTEISYYWLEGSMPPGYFLKDEDHEGTVTTLTNSWSEYDLETVYTGVKNWEDEDDRFGTRPADLHVTLQRRISSSAPWTDYRYDPTWQKSGNTWTYTFDHVPVFDENGNVYEYRAVETLPGGYSQAESVTDTSYQFGTLEFLTSKQSAERITPDKKLVWQLDSLIDLAVAAVKTTANDPTLVWTSRTPTPQERAAIEAELSGSSNPLPGHNPNLIWIHGTEISSDSHGQIGFTMEGTRVTLSFTAHSVWSQFVIGQFNNDSGAESSYLPGTTVFTNTLETVSLSGTKTWNIEGETVPADPILTLSRTVTTTQGEGDAAVTVTSAPEVVKVMQGGTQVNLQPEWSGAGKNRTFVYSGLPKYDRDGKEYTYSVAEASFVIGEGDDAVTYTAVRAADGTYTVTADKIGATVYAVAQSGNNITNGLVEASIEIIKVEKGHKDNDHTLSGAKFQLTKVDENGNNVSGADAYQSEIVTVDPATGKAEFAGLGPGRYKLEEKESPDGYILAESPWYFTVDASGTAELQAGYTLALPVGEGHPNEFWIENTPGAALPNTGGPGTSLLYLLGFMLTGLAGTGLMLKRRRRNAA